MFIRVLCTKRRKKETPNPLKIEGNGELKCAKHTFLYLLYQKECYVLKSVAADSLGLTGTSITRASEQLVAMGLIEQEKVGKEVRMFQKSSSKELLKKAKPYLISPVQKKMVVKAKNLSVQGLKAGETALSEYSMLNVPKLRTVAVYKGAIECDVLEEVDARWEEEQELVLLELWKYNPLLFEKEGKVDQISLACSMADCKDERVEMAVEEMLEELVW